MSKERGGRLGLSEEPGEYEVRVVVAILHTYEVQYPLFRIATATYEWLPV
jgi:hypothetical protein